ncbi:MAG: hypothetical protein AUJ98_01240 [Bacteroidetes bacterium CG2_30_33_31]|nr:MAG: hypothetical protein AUJ98_01240 [Bacteroidetes bacterium CG2_30_33_31]
MKNKLFAILLIAQVIMLSSISAFGQDGEEETDKTLVRAPFSTSVLMNTQTMVLPAAKGLEFHIQHRFGTVKKGYDDLFGIFAPSNIRLGLTYGVTDRVSLGWGITKAYMLNDFNVKVAILQQTRSNSMPIFLTYYGNVTLDTRKSTDITKFTQRFSYLNQIIFGRKINRLLSLEGNVAFSHFNIIDTIGNPDLGHGNLSAGISGKMKISSKISGIFEYDYQITSALANQQKSNLGLGIEIATATHSFEIFLGTSDAISQQRDMVYGVNDFTKGALLFGFNITKTW